LRFFTVSIVFPFFYFTFPDARPSLSKIATNAGLFFLIKYHLLGAALAVCPFWGALEVFSFRVPSVAHYPPLFAESIILFLSFFFCGGLIAETRSTLRQDLFFPFLLQVACFFRFM